MSVGGVSVNSHCRQGGLFALIVNRHSNPVYIIVMNDSHINMPWYLLGTPT